eukprot:CAMPEP_0179044942 /NCGR_PEP_ID=MMETSP0796-20121207/17926_1 /TAXON_ID=73915 /ORGANISM="Pyrodinium bahamense, Strain pbaha01" /LENGTH=39 /DNA_ID= /DNA_START= /DNA_END= /DNA_ORIENTATION=
MAALLAPGASRRAQATISSCRARTLLIRPCGLLDVAVGS